MNRRDLMKFGIAFPFIPSLLSSRQGSANEIQTNINTLHSYSSDELEAQVNTLRHLASRKTESINNSYPSTFPGTTITIASSKGGVGKTIITANLSVSLSKKGYRVLVVDPTPTRAFYGVLGVDDNAYSLYDVFEKKARPSDLLSVSKDGIEVINISYEEFMVPEYRPFITEIFRQFDVRLVDMITARRIPTEIIESPLVGEIVVITTTEPPSILEAYAWLKIDHLNNPRPNSKYWLLVNQVETQDEGLEVYQTLHQVSEKYLSKGFDYLGSIPDELDIRKSIRQQQAAVSLFPKSEYSVQLQKLSEKLVAEKIITDCLEV
jgi:flagellar biosynthesis protein FlhG